MAYEQHPKSQEGHPKIHQLFLESLKQMLPQNCKPIVTTDAGFKNPWFKDVLALGWDYVGRVRGFIYCQNEEATWETSHNLMDKATSVPQCLGSFTVAKTNPLMTTLYCVKKALKGRQASKHGRVRTDKDSRYYARREREAWLLTTSLGKGNKKAEKIVAVYAQRMTIEEGFRDLKSGQYGLSFEDNHTLKKKRLTVWLLLAALACLWAYLMGLAAETVGLHLQFQANSIRTRRVLSYFYLGCQIIRKKISIPLDIFIPLTTNELLI